MRVIQFVAQLDTFQYNFYVELSQAACGLQFAAQYRQWWNQNGSVTNEGMDKIRSTLEGWGMSCGILATFDNDELHALLVNYTLIVHEEVVRVSKPCID